MTTASLAPTGVGSELQLATFSAAGLCLALEIGEIQEIIRTVDVTAAPNSPPAVSGVINLRGEVTTVLDLSALLGSQPRTESDARTRILIVRAGGESVGLMVDSVGDIASVPRTDVLPPPPNVDSVAGRFFKGVYPRSTDIIVILNLDEALHSASASVKKCKD